MFKQLDYVYDLAIKKGKTVISSSSLVSIKYYTYSNLEMNLQIVICRFDCIIE